MRHAGSHVVLDNADLFVACDRFDWVSFDHDMSQSSFGFF